MRKDWKISKSEIDGWILLLLIVLLSAGAIGAGLQPVRVLILAFSPVFFWHALADLSFRRKFRWEIVVLFLWLVWAILSLGKAEDFKVSLLSVIYLSVGMFGFLELLWLSDHVPNSAHLVRRGWMLMLMLTLPLAFVELVTDYHLPLSYQEAGSVQKVAGEYVERNFASVTFGNLNSYNTILCMGLPFVLQYILLAATRKQVIKGAVLLVLCAYLILANSSRAALFCLLLDIVMFVSCYAKNGKSLKWLLAFGAIVAVVFVKYLADNFSLIIGRILDQGLNDDGRLENLVKGWQAFVDSNFMGIGTGNYESIMTRLYNVRIPAPHNLWLEVLVTFGIVVFAGFMGMHVRIWRLSLGNHRLAIMFFLTLLFVGIIDSNYLLKVPTWIFLASLYVVLRTPASDNVGLQLD